MPIFVAHYSKNGKSTQSAQAHAEAVGKKAENFANAVEMPNAGRLIGLLHDMGKWTIQFFEYLRAAVGLEGDARKKWAVAQKGKVDHATAGAQFAWKAFEKHDHPFGKITAQILAVGIASHHNSKGMLDGLSPNGDSSFFKRIRKAESETRINEATKNIEPTLRTEIDQIIASGAPCDEIQKAFCKIKSTESTPSLRLFHAGLLTRFLLSCLLDADRLDTAEFEVPKRRLLRKSLQIPDWDLLLSKLVTFLGKKTPHGSIDEIRNRISQTCRNAAAKSRGLFSLTVPTGGGKTFSSLLFGLAHAEKHSRENPRHPIRRIIYVIPYTTIIEQNAGEVSKILGAKNVLEQHSNLIPKKDTLRNRILSENWDSPIVFTTSVALLDALFAGSTQAARKMHQLANAIIIFDEIQTLPIKTVHMFNNAVNFLTRICNSTVVLCTATQPLLGNVDKTLGALDLSIQNEIIPDAASLFRSLKRTDIVNLTRPRGWTYAEAAELARTELENAGSVLIVVNTKKCARALYDELKETDNAKVYHLSTNMCPAHRKKILKHVNKSLKFAPKRRIICVSTPLIEAGVDVDFGCVIRAMAGLASLGQAAGRCNRNNRMENKGLVFVINLAAENIDKLIDIKHGQTASERIFREYDQNPDAFDNDLLSPAAMNQYYEYYFHNRAGEMDYPVSSSDHGNLTLLDLLSCNNSSLNSAARISANELGNIPPLRQAFSTVAQHFEVIDAPTCAIIVPYNKKAAKIIADLVACYTRNRPSLEEQFKLLRSAQQYTVNLFPHALKKLRENKAANELGADAGIFHLNEQHYDKNLGITDEITMSMTTHIT